MSIRVIWPDNSICVCIKIRSVIVPLFTCLFVPLSHTFRNFDVVLYIYFCPLIIHWRVLWHKLIRHRMPTCVFLFNPISCLLFYYCINYLNNSLKWLRNISWKFKTLRDPNTKSDSICCIWISEPNFNIHHYVYGLEQSLRHINWINFRYFLLFHIKNQEKPYRKKI